MCISPATAAISDAGDITADAPSAPTSIIEDTNNQQWKNHKFGDINNLQSAASSSEIQPFGSQLFHGGFRGTRSDGKNANYKVAPGDQITLRVWGAIEFERILAVDARGNVFIPSIGPVKVQGLTPKSLDRKVRSAIRSIYPENVQVYTHLQGVQPVAVFVTGYVNNPGRYAGTPNDSALYFLDQAGGIDNTLGSYRNVKLIRNRKVIATIDFYDFLLLGKLSRIQFKDGDTLLIKERKISVMVTGDVKKQYSYELLADMPQGLALIQLARLKAGVSHVLLKGARAKGANNKYFTIEDFSQTLLKDGDEVIVSADQRSASIVVQIEGSYYGPSRFALSRNIMLKDFLDSIAVPEHITDTQSISIRRLSVAQSQQKSLEESLRRLETTYLGAPSSTPQEANIRIQEAELINKFIARARQVKPSGRLVVSLRGEVANIRLKDGDIITIPEKSDAILISGEVLVPQSVIFTAGRSVKDYIAGAGGFSQHANDEHILIVRINGEVINAKHTKIIAGDEILVLPKAPTKNLQLATTFTQILYQLAIATKVVIDL
ncbi:MAG: polysaccharide export protein [Osedax symbiont Rs1]|nr:MAG: polysaccharide export protein [Osedax symbiont Rs1]